ncbi:MAG: NUDIX hydrolase [Chloroflexi bacterium]|nr:NUDIX hydrolase [Chloroflexota bacterium]MCI0835056.1 NUDIX hydrolase [Chloroflexota bacterium]MCI0837584.1 NUDIX hydrolase [Chloroflexota bacterium]MCI0852307.1 NUDIX hydrolase [Chloroflexota bacterium]MCI0872129.1 NUDIX hydrolase [Chloroflexota bacterium]
MTHDKSEPPWLRWGRELQAIAQNGLAFDANPYDVERYQQIRSIAAEMIAPHVDADADTVVDYFLKETGYATPKIDCRGVVWNTDGKVLLVKGTADEKWTLPGGWMDVNYSPAENVEREILEESGLTTRATRIIALYDKRKHYHRIVHIYQVFFECLLISGELRTSTETSDVGFFGRDEIPELSLERVSPDQLTQAFHFHDNPDAPLIFD